MKTYIVTGYIYNHDKKYTYFTMTTQAPDENTCIDTIVNLFLVSVVISHVEECYNYDKGVQ